MRKMSFAFIAALVLAAVGCSKTGGADCAQAINHGMELSKADMAKMPGMDDKMLEKLKDLGLQHCKDDKWSDEVLKCMSEAKSQADGQLRGTWGYTRQFEGGGLLSVRPQ